MKLLVTELDLDINRNELPSTSESLVIIFIYWQKMISELSTNATHEELSKSLFETRENCKMLEERLCTVEEEKRVDPLISFYATCNS